MNHVPNEVLAAIDRVGRGVLLEDPIVLRERLRSDFRLRIDCDESAFADSAASITFRLERASARDALRDHGSYVCTIVDNVDSHLAGWGIEPPPAYPHRATEDGWQVYAGTLSLRGLGD